MSPKLRRSREALVLTNNDKVVALKGARLFDIGGVDPGLIASALGQRIL